MLTKKLFVLIAACCLASLLYAQTTRLNNGFSHNDYWRKHPLFDALRNGCPYVEADVYLRGGNLVVSHILPCLRKKKTLERLYLEPLLKGRFENGEAFPDNPITLLIDIKSNADKTYTLLDSMLEKYKSIITTYEDGVITWRKVTIVLSGHRPYDRVRELAFRRVFIDEDLRKIPADQADPGVDMLASCRYSHFLKWTGKGAMPVDAKDRLVQYVQAAHQNDLKVRLWASPDNTKVWKALLDCGVDLINTNKIQKLKRFLTTDASVAAP